MGDVGDMFNDLKANRRAIRAKFGVNCPRCNEKQPKRTPSLLLPGQQCKVDGYRDPRTRLSDDERQQALTHKQFNRCTTDNHGEVT